MTPVPVVPVNPIVSFMGFLDALDYASDLMILFVALLCLVYSIVYLSFFRWRSNMAGRAVAYLVLSLTAVLALNGLGRWTGSNYPGREFIRFAIYFGIMVSSLNLLHVLLTYFHQGQTLSIDPRLSKEEAPTPKDEGSDS